MSSPAAVYERELPVSLERIWENVLDWEHLPHLHSQAFSSISLLSHNDDGWRAEIGLPGTSGKGAEIDVRLDRAGLCYWSRTVSGAGEGTEILTRLFPRGPEATGILVEFHVPWAADESKASIGEMYRTLYVELWDQDEAMMRERQRVLDACRRVPSAHEQDSVRTVSLGRVRELAHRLPLDVELAGRRLRVVSIDGRLVAYDTRCPHLGGPLAAGPGCEAVCPWHGYRFDVRSGASSDGRGLRMGRAAVIEINACEGDVTLRLP